MKCLCEWHMQQKNQQKLIAPLFALMELVSFLSVSFVKEATDTRKFQEFMLFHI